MEFMIERNELLQGLYLTQGIVERRTTIPILANVLFESVGDGVSIAATDQEVGFRRRCTAKVKKKGALTTGARKLYEIVRECPEGTLIIRALENNWIEISSGKSRFKIVGLDPKEFPAMPSASSQNDPQAVKVSVGVLKEMIEHTVFAVSLDETRPNLSGIFLERREVGKIRLVATDGHRLSMITREVDASSGGESFIIPRKGVAEVLKVLEGGDQEEVVSVSVNAGVAHLSRGEVELSMRLVEGEFPDYTQVVPQQSTKKMSTAAEPLLSALRRVSIVSSERTRGVKLCVEKGVLEVSSINPDLGEASDEIDVEFSDGRFEIGFNAKYMLDVLAIFPQSGKVEVCFNDEVSPGVIRHEQDENYLCVIMPMRL